MKQKLYPCSECGRKVPVRSKGKCPTCRGMELQASKPRVQKKPKVARRKKRDSCLDLYFQYHLQQLEVIPYSAESGTRISNPSTANVCHLLPKRNSGFPSVKCNTDNCIYLTIQEHADFDSLLDKREYEKLEKKFPNSWGKTCEKLKSLLSLCTERNKMYFSLQEYLKTRE